MAEIPNTLIAELSTALYDLDTATGRLRGTEGAGALSPFDDLLAACSRIVEAAYARSPVQTADLRAANMTPDAPQTALRCA